MKTDTFKFIKGWKIIQYVSLILSLLFFVLYFLPPPSLKPFIPYVSIITGFVFYGLYLVLSILILYGIYKKLKIGYYLSVVYLLLQLIDSATDIIWGIKYQEFTLIPLDAITIVFVIILGYLLYKERSYFGIK